MILIERIFKLLDAFHDDLVRIVGQVVISDICDIECI